ncbi:MAG: spermidine/putrescine ABC transporter substrate-binding protein, partial [Solirubrobacterales bacterium]
MSRKRRRALTRVGLALMALAATIVLAACGGGIEELPENYGGSGGGNEVKIEGKPSGEMTISNWPLYIDKKTVGDFEKETGVSVKYVEDVNSNEEFFAKLQPQLAQGESGKRS